MKLLPIFILFSAIEIFLRTFVDAYKYNTVGIFLQVLPFIIASFISLNIYKTSIIKGHLGCTYFKLIAASICGLLVAKVFLFVQWYWFISPEYRKVPGDMSEGFGFTMIFFMIESFVIMITYFLSIFTIKSTSN